MAAPPRQPCFWLRPDPLILASRSQARLALLRAAQIPVDAHPSDLDERALGASVEDPVGVACLLARAKALAVSQVFPRRLVLGADQILVLEGEILHKPADHAGLKRRLHRLSGRTHYLHSAAALALDGSILFQTSDEAALTCRVLTSNFIQLYLGLSGDRALESVGGYEVEGFGIHLFDRIEGQHATIQGLPMLELLAHLRQMGHLAG